MTARSRPLAAAFATLFVCASAAAQDDAPSDDFLEYLATLVEQDGEWVDPLTLDGLPEEEAELDTQEEATDSAQPAEETP